MTGSDRSSVTYGYLSLMRASMDCPEWDDEEGDESLFAGKHPEAWMPRVYSEERDAVVGRRYERVALVELPERMKSDDAFDWARENQPGPLDEWYEDDEPEIATDGGTEQTVTDQYGTIEEHVGTCRTCDRRVVGDGSSDGFESVERELASHIDDGTACHDYSIQAVYQDGGERRVA